MVPQQIRSGFAIQISGDSVIFPRNFAKVEKGVNSGRAFANASNLSNFPGGVPK